VGTRFGKKTLNNLIFSLSFCIFNWEWGGVVAKHVSCPEFNTQQWKKIKKNKKASRVAHIVQHQVGKHKALSSNPSTPKHINNNNNKNLGARCGGSHL
jgi:hypothetical protein